MRYSNPKLVVTNQKVDKKTETLTCSLFPVPSLGARSLSWSAFRKRADGDAGSDRLRLSPTRGRTAVP